MPKKSTCLKKNAKSLKTKKSRPKQENLPKKVKQENLPKQAKNSCLANLLLPKQENLLQKRIFDKNDEGWPTVPLLKIISDGMESDFINTECPFCFKKFENETTLESHVASHSTYARTLGWYQHCHAVMMAVEEKSKSHPLQALTIELEFTVNTMNFVVTKK